MNSCFFIGYKPNKTVANVKIYNKIKNNSIKCDTIKKYFVSLIYQKAIKLIT